MRDKLAWGPYAGGYGRMKTEKETNQKGGAEERSKSNFYPLRSFASDHQSYFLLKCFLYKVIDMISSLAQASKI